MILLRPKMIFSLIIAILLMACNETKSPSNVKARGEEPTLKTTLLEKGASLTRKRSTRSLECLYERFSFS